MKNAMVKDIAIGKDGAQENQDPKKMKIIIMINRSLGANVMYKTKIETTFVMEIGPATAKTDCVKEKQDDLSIS